MTEWKKCTCSIRIDWETDGAERNHCIWVAIILQIHWYCWVHAGLLTRHLEILLKLPSGCSRDMTRCRNCFGALGMPKESSQENISKKYAECRTCVLCKFFNMHISSQKTDEKRASFHSRNSTSVFMKRSNFHFREKKLHKMSFQQPPPPQLQPRGQLQRQSLWQM